MKEKYSEYNRPFWISVITATLFFIPFIVALGGKFFLTADFNVQQIPFYMFANESIKSGNYFWSWGTDLGSNFISSYSFYLLGSPFFWLSTLFPAAAVPYIIAPLMILKHAVAAVTSYAYIRQYVKNKNYALIGCLLYAFSGFGINNLFYHFLDAAAFFPLLLLSLDKLVKENKKGFFALSVALCAFTNYVFFFGQVIFLIIYFLCKLLSGEYRVSVKKFAVLAFESVTGFLMSSVIVLPSVIDTLNNPRISYTFSNIKESLFYTLKDYVLILKSFLLPPDIQTRASIFDNRYSSTEMWLPLFGLVLVAAYIIHAKKRKNSLIYILGSCLFFMFIPLLNSSFSLFNTRFYTRWYYMLILILALCSAKALEEGYCIKRSLIFMSAASFLIIPIIAFFPREDGVALNINSSFFYTIVGIATLCYLCVFVLFYKFKNHKNFQNLLIYTLVAVIVVSNGLFLKESIHISEGQSYFDNFIYTRDKISLPDDEFYRTESPTWNTSLLNGTNDIIFWSSTVSASIFEFYTGAYICRLVDSRPPAELYGLRPLLSVKYIFSGQRELPSNIPYGEQNNMQVYENTDFIPMGFTFDYYIAEDEFMALPMESRHLVLLKAIVIKNNDIPFYKNMIEHIPAGMLSDLSVEAYKKDIEDRRRASCSSFVKKQNAFDAEITLPEDKLVFFSIPYESGWFAAVNGKPVKIINADKGLMAIKCNSGQNSIAFKYVPSGFKIGLALSLLSALLLMAYAFWFKYKKIKLTESALSKSALLFTGASLTGAFICVLSLLSTVVLLFGASPSIASIMTCIIAFSAGLLLILAVKMCCYLAELLSEIKTLSPKTDDGGKGDK